LIERFYLKNHLSFREVTLEFDHNFIVFTGASGAGKSVLMEALLALFGLKECDAGYIEATVAQKLNLEDYGIEEDSPNIFRMSREKTARYFINNRQVSKKNIKTISKGFINYLSLREFTEFENDNLIALLDAIAATITKSHPDLLHSYHETYLRHKKISAALTKILEEEKKVQELKEFTIFEIDKIEKIAPVPEEYDALMQQKRELSKKEKIEQSIEEASQIFQHTPKVAEALQLLETESTFFDDAITQLEAIFEEARGRLDELADIDIEYLLDRIEQLSSLKRKHGSIEEALIYLQKKKEELEHYENLSFEKEQLQKDQTLLQKEVDKLAGQLTKQRTKALKILQERVEHYLRLLYLEQVTFSIAETTPGENGKDQINIQLKTADLKKISAGELNRLRLAFLAASSEFVHEKGGVLVLDEIDANVSGKESMSIATVLKQLSHTYQIFAISHQPQLSSAADIHFLVHKENEESSVSKLDHEGRIKELSRMISAEEISDEAVNFAKSLLEKR